MKKLVPNPEYASAPYELQLWNKEKGLIADALPNRFHEPYPETIKDSKSLWAWVMVHRIPEYIEVEED